MILSEYDNDLNFCSALLEEDEEEIVRCTSGCITFEVGPDVVELTLFEQEIALSFHWSKINFGISLGI